MSFTTSDVESAFENEQFESFSNWVKENYADSDGWGSVSPDDGWGELGYGGEGRVTINGQTYPWKPVTHIGGEGQGEYAAVIFEIDGRMFRKEGYYASHYGTDWDGTFEEVEAFEKTVTDYRSV